MQIVIWTTKNCNFNCDYCYEGSIKENKHMKIKTAQQLVRYVSKVITDKDIKELSIVFHGGEPLLNFEAIKYICNSFEKLMSKCRIYFSITTNGYLLNDEISKYLIKHKFSVSISIDGMKLTHDLYRKDMRGQGTHDVVIEHAQKYLEKDSHVRIRMTFNSNTVKNLFENVKYLLDKGFKNVIPCADFYDEKWSQNSIEILEKQLIKIKQNYSSLVNKKEIVIGMISDLEFKKRTICDGGKDSFHIDINGDIYPCVASINKINYMIGDIITGIDKTKIRELNAINAKRIQVCDGCNYYDYCTCTRCKLINENITSNYYLPSPVMCNIENIKLRISKY